jgi:MFS superfamily sulfate permease-like transporter
LKDRFDLDPYIVGIRKETVFSAGFDGADWGGLIGASIPVAVIAILETQIAAKLADIATGTVFDSKREVLGTALSNIVCGITGGAPVCGAMARMTLNINTGAKSRTSLVINSFVVLILTFVLFPFFKFLPQPIIGAVLVPVAVSMIKRKVYVHYWKMDKPAFIQCMVVFLVCVFVDPTYAIIVAIILGCLREAGNMRMIAPADFAVIDLASGELLRSVGVDQGTSNASSAQQEFTPLVGEDFVTALNSIQRGAEAPTSAVVVYRPSASWTFTNKTQHAERINFLKQHPHVGHVIISLAHVHYMDLDGCDALRDIYAAFKSSGASLRVCDYNDVLLARLQTYPWHPEAVTEGTAHSQFSAAVKSLQSAAPAKQDTKIEAVATATPAQPSAKTEDFEAVVESV